MYCLSISLLRYMVDFRISSGRLFHVDVVIYRKALRCVCKCVNVDRYIDFQYYMIVIITS